MTALLCGCIALGVASAAVGFAVAPLDTWLWLLVSFVIASGVVNGMLVWAAVFRVAQTRWTPVINRVSQSALAFVPALAAMLIVLLAGVRHYAPWAQHPVPGKEGWLNVPFMVVREVLSLGGWWFLCLLLVRWSLVADAKTARGQEITQREHYRLNAIALAVVLGYTVASSIVACDFVMSLSPTWVSEMFPPYIFCTNACVGLAALILCCNCVLKSRTADKYLQPQQFKDMGNLMLGFSLLNAGFFFAQYLTIWYENLPLETHFILIRYMYGPWPPLGWAAFLSAYMIPFVILQSRYVKLHARLLSGVAVLALAGFALERYVLIVPSIEPRKLMLFPVPVLMLLGLWALFVLLTRRFLSRYPIVSSADDALRKIQAEEVGVL